MAALSLDLRMRILAAHQSGKYASFKSGVGNERFPLPVFGGSQNEGRCSWAVPCEGAAVPFSSSVAGGSVAGSARPRIARPAGVALSGLL